MPTRELGIQICNTLIKIGRACVNIVPGLLVGGENIKKEKEKIRKGLNIIVGTPGRVKYHLENTSNFIPDKLSSIVIEECDRMFDMGFEREMKFIFEKMRDEVENSQKILVSACITNKVEGLLFKLDLDLEGDLKLIGFNDTNMKELDLPDTLSHLYITLDERNKIIYFIMLCKLFLQKKVVIFVATADEANYLEALLKNFNEYYDKVEDQKEPIFQTNINKIHGYMHQKDRSAVFGDFITQDHGFLICTDVGSRGLNFENISIIILFDVSVSYKDYINRVGRTARIDKVGSAISLLNPCEDKYAQKLKENCKITEIDKIELDRLFMDLTGEANNSHYHKINRVINMFNMNEDNNYLARRAFNSFCRAYSMLKDKDCFNLKNMNLHAISKSFGLSDSNSRRRKVISNYNEIKDSKNFLKPKLNDQEKKTDLMRK